MKTSFTYLRQTLDELEALAEDMDSVFDLQKQAMSEAEQPNAGETVTTRREETRPDGTRIITTVTRTKS